MSNLVIKAENISKQYRLGQVGTGTLTHDLNRFWHKIRGNEDPYLKIGEANDRSSKGSSEYVWSLQDINFDVEQGDAVGIIGRNGAGKSTLLKILSKVTKPTTGKIYTQGRIASLLEVGTGFHPEMTGRENIYLNGAILGMTKKEITRKFDEIVDFSGVERYIDTPVKRYSSGMYVRLAFAVAAHLESEILIVDEVLAVGDAEFQKKCLGKMGDVTKGEGRTILFVSHNMTAIQNLCNNCILLEKGGILSTGKTHDVLNSYQISNKQKENNLINFERDGNGKCRVNSVDIITNYDNKTKDVFFLGDTINIVLKIKKISLEKLENIRIIIGVYNIFDEGYLRFDTKVLNSNISIIDEETVVSCEILENLNIKPDRYYINIAVFENEELVDHVVNSFNFQIENADYYETGKIIENIELSKINYKHKWNQI